MDCNGELTKITYNGDERIAIDVTNGSHHKHEAKNGECFEKQGDVVLEKYTQSNWQKDGQYQKFNEKGWLEAEAGYKAGELDGVCKEYNSDGTVASLKHYDNGKEDTVKYLAMREIAQMRVTKSEQKRKEAAEKILKKFWEACWMYDHKDEAEAEAPDFGTMQPA